MTDEPASRATVSRSGLRGDQDETLPEVRQDDNWV